MISEISDQLVKTDVLIFLADPLDLMIVPTAKYRRLALRNVSPRNEVPDVFRDRLASTAGLASTEAAIDSFWQWADPEEI